MADLFEPNPRAVVGANFPPCDEPDAPTIEEARLVASAIEYIQAFSEGLEDLLVKRKGGRLLGWRLALANILKDRVRQNSLRQLLGFNRKTMGENQQRCDAWAEHDDEHGDGSFGRHMEALRSAVEAHSFVDRVALEKQLKAYVKLDPELRRLEEQKRAHELAEQEALAAAASLEAAEAEQKAKAEIRAMAKTLKGIEHADAIIAERMGPKRLAKEITDPALAVIEKLAKADAKGARRNASELNPQGLQECIRLGLARESIPHLAPRPEDPPIAPTDLGRRVFVKAVEEGRIKAKKRMKA